MKKNFMMAVVIGIAASSASASAELAKSKNCMGCHAVSSKLVGPAFKDVGHKYAGQPGADAALALKILKGSSGTWGPIPMPPSPQVTSAEATSLALWILSQR